jgi:hypothetical protein
MGEDTNRQDAVENREAQIEDTLLPELVSKGQAAARWAAERNPQGDPDSGSDRYVLGTLEERLVRFLKEQPDVTAVDEVGDGIYGILMDATENEGQPPNQVTIHRTVPISLMVNVTP